MKWAASARSDNNCILAADIDMAGMEWTPKSFSGTFDGQEHTISNLTVSGSDYVGFISFLGNSGVVKDLTLTNASVTGTNETSYGYTGGIAGSVQNRGVISGCSFSGEVKSTGSYAGGIAGWLFGSTITACYSTATVSGSAAGGVAGYMNDGDTTACYWSSVSGY